MAKWLVRFSFISPIVAECACWRFFISPWREGMQRPIKLNFLPSGSFQSSGRDKTRTWRPQLTGDNGECHSEEWGPLQRARGERHHLTPSRRWYSENEDWEKHSSYLRRALLRKGYFHLKNQKSLCTCIWTNAKPLNSYLEDKSLSRSNCVICVFWRVPFLCGLKVCVKHCVHSEALWPKKGFCREAGAYGDKMPCVSLQEV